MSDITSKILNKIFNIPEKELFLFDDLSILKIYEKEEGKYYLKSLSADEKELIVHNEKTNKSKPENIVRELYIHKLLKEYKYPKNLIEIEKSVNFGREVKRADIVVFSDDKVTPRIIIEVKAPNQKNDIEQLKSYLNAEGAIAGVATNGKVSLILYRPYPKDFDDTLSDIPHYGEDIQDVLSKRKTLSDLKEVDLKNTIMNLDELVLANSGQDSFDEIFKLIYAKLFDEKEALGRNNQELLFRKSPTGDAVKTKNTIDSLFEDAKKEWPNIFDKKDNIKLNPEHLSVCVGEIQDIRLFGSDLRIIDEAFEYLIPDVAKQKKGQYFTPRVVIDFCVKVLNPKNKEYVIDTACGSAGFLIHAMQHVSETYFNKNSSLTKEYASRYLYGIDFDEKLAKISRALMLIAGDGKSNIFKTSSLDQEQWPEVLKDNLKNNNLITEYEDYEKNQFNKSDLRNLNFDIILANPPFAGEIKEKKLISKFELGKNKNNKIRSKIERHILFIEQNINFLKPGGRMAVVLPQGIFNNSTQEDIRKYLIKSGRILGVVGLHINAFKTHTTTKTSVLLIQKWKTEELDEGGNPIISNYPIFFASQKVSFKNNRGEYLFQTDSEGQPIYDESGNPKYLSDLDSLKDEFIKWGKKERFDFL